MNNLTAYKIIKFIGNGNPKYDFKNIRNFLDVIPVNDEGFIDENGKQGKWIVKKSDFVDVYYAICLYHNDEIKNIELYDDYDRLRAKGKLNNSHNKIGKWVYFTHSGRDADRTLDKCGYYVDGLKNGEWRSYFSFNRLHIIQNFSSGIKEGEYKLYDPDKKFLKVEGNYKNNKKNGTWNLYNDDGKHKKLILNFDNGTFELYDEKGLIRTRNSVDKKRDEGLFKFLDSQYFCSTCLPQIN